MHSTKSIMNFWIYNTRNQNHFCILFTKNTFIPYELFNNVNNLNVLLPCAWISSIILSIFSILFLLFLYKILYSSANLPQAAS